MENKKHILIHPDHVEDLDKKYEKLEKNKKKPQMTGYSSICRIRNTKHHKDILFSSGFVRKKMPTRAFFIFKELGKDSVMLQPCKTQWMHRTHINHVIDRIFGWLHLYRYKATLEITPPCQIFYDMKISPLCKSYTFYLEEWVVQDEHDGETFAYKLAPLAKI